MNRPFKRRVGGPWDAYTARATEPGGGPRGPRREGSPYPPPSPGLGRAPGACTVRQSPVLHRAVAHFARLGVEVERVLSDNGSAYRWHAWRDACTELGIKPKRTRPYRPQTNGKIERFHRTLAVEPRMMV